MLMPLNFRIEDEPVSLHSFRKLKMELRLREELEEKQKT